MTTATTNGAPNGGVGAVMGAAWGRLTTGQKVALAATLMTLVGRQVVIVNVETVVLVATASFGAFIYTRFGATIAEALEGRGVELMAELEAHADAQAAHVRAMAAVARARTAWHRARGLASGSTRPVLLGHTASARPGLAASGRAMAFVAGTLARPTAARDRQALDGGRAWAQATRAAGQGGRSGLQGLGAQGALGALGAVLTGGSLSVGHGEEARAL